MKKELYINLGYIGQHAEIFQELFKGYSKEPNQYGYFLLFENFTHLACNEGVMCITNCFENEEHFREILNGKLIWEFLENKLINK
jgi:hypothetical protein